MIEAYIIDEVTEELSASEKAFEHAVELMNQQQPILLSYLFSESFEAFTQAERAYLLFLAAVLWKSAFRTWGAQEEITEQALSLAEDRNWGLLQHAGKGFRERMNVFFDDLPSEEEALAFIEDALLDDDESPVTTEGREPLFVTLKSIMDCLVVPHQA
jgi:hypothetical protein